MSSTTHLFRHTTHKKSTLSIFFFYFVTVLGGETSTSSNRLQLVSGNLSKHITKTEEDVSNPKTTTLPNGCLTIFAKNGKLIKKFIPHPMAAATPPPPPRYNTEWTSAFTTAGMLVIAGKEKTVSITSTPIAMTPLLLGQPASKKSPSSSQQDCNFPTHEPTLNYTKKKKKKKFHFGILIEL